MMPTRTSIRSIVVVPGAVAFYLCIFLSQGTQAVSRVPEADGRVRGHADAPVTLVEYSDFTCGYCVKFFRDTWPRIQARYVETGKVRFLYRDYPRADQGPGLDAAVAARCAGDQGRYWAMHDRLFADGGRLSAETIDRHAKSIGMEPRSFGQCLRDGRYVKAIFEDRHEANEWGFRGTPGFILYHTATGYNGKQPAVGIPGAFPFEMFEEEIEKLLATAPHSREDRRSHAPGAVLSPTGVVTRLGDGAKHL